MGRKIIIGELNGITTETTLQTAFDPWGTIDSLSIDSIGGHITYTTSAAGDLAVREMDGSTLDGSVISVAPDD